MVRAFVDAKVRFAVVGGRAAQFHGYARPAKNLDILVEPSADNWPKLPEALRPLKAAVPRFEELSPQKRYQARIRFYCKWPHFSPATSLRGANATFNDTSFILPLILSAASYPSTTVPKSRRPRLSQRNSRGDIPWAALKRRLKCEKSRTAGHKGRHRDDKETMATAASRL